MAHLLYNSAEKVRAYFEDVDRLISSVKAATVKNASRRSLFSNVGLPPQPVVTRWGTWLYAATFYADNLMKRMCCSFSAVRIPVD